MARPGSDDEAEHEEENKGDKESQRA